MSNDGGRNGNRSVNGPRNYRVRLFRFGSQAAKDFKPSPITVHDTATSNMQARTNAQAGYPDYIVTDVMES